jgi:uncharacterized membrane protein
MLAGRQRVTKGKGMRMNASRVLRIIATICFALAVFGVVPAPVLLIPLGLALWCGSTLVP